MSCVCKKNMKSIEKCGRKPKPDSKYCGYHQTCKTEYSSPKKPSPKKPSHKKPSPKKPSPKKPSPKKPQYINLNEKIGHQILILGEGQRVHNNITYRDLYNCLKIKGNFKDIYTRWEVINDKQRLIYIMSSPFMKIYPDHFFVMIEDLLFSSDCFFSLNPHKTNHIIQSMVTTYNHALQSNPSIKNVGTTALIYHGGVNLTLTKYFNLLANFIHNLPKEIQIEFAKQYVTAWVEGYDLRLETFPDRVTVFTGVINPVTRKMDSPSCYMGLIYQPLIVLYTILFESHPDCPKFVPIFARRQYISGLLEIYAERYGDEVEDITKKNDPTLIRYVEGFKTYARQKIKHDIEGWEDDSWNTLIDEVADSTYMSYDTPSPIKLSPKKP